MSLSEVIKVLLVDDNPGDVLLCKEILSQQTRRQFRIQHVARLSTGLRKLRSVSYDVILLDLSLPDSQGIDTFVKIKMQVRDLPIIVLTGMHDEELAINAVRKGAQDYLLKDELSESLLVRSINYAIERSGAEEKRRWLEMKMLYAQKLESLSVLSGGVAQNFNSLLTAILGNSELAMEKLDEENPAFRNLQKIESSAAQASELAQQMLQYAGMGRFVVETLDMSKLVKDITTLVESIASRRITIHYELSDDLPLIKADVPQIQQMILNLVVNAAEAIGDNPGEITISTSAIRAETRWLRDAFLTDELSPGTYTRIKVIDSGPGIPAEDRPKIFDPFYTTKFTGRGLGLAAVKGIVRGHGGAIRVYSEVGKGTTMDILFPKVKEEVVKESPEVSENSQLERYVLLAISEPQVLEVAKSRMENAGYHVVIGEDKHHTIQILKKKVFDIDLAILDVPRYQSGFTQFLRQLRHIAPKMKIILTSDYANGANFSQIGTVKVDFILKKPYRSEELLKKVNEVFTAQY